MGWVGKRGMYTVSASHSLCSVAYACRVAGTIKPAKLLRRHAEIVEWPERGISIAGPDRTQARCSRSEIPFPSEVSPEL